MTWRSAPAVRAALDEATQLWPNRNRTSDGTIGDAAHSNRTSDHNPDERGVVLAFDLTHDPVNGCDAHALVAAAVNRRDPRIKYAISNRRIWSKKHASEGWRLYVGSNPHVLHAHVSVDREHEDNVSPWWQLAAQPPPPPPPGWSPVSVATQRAINVPADGYWGPNTDLGVNVVRSAINSSFPLGVKTAQARVGIRQDGSWGPLSRAALKQTIAELQRAWSTIPDGVWGHNTEIAWTRARQAYYIK